LDTSGNVLWASFLAVNNSSQSRIATDPAGDAYILTGPVYSQLGYLPTTPNTIGLPATGLSTNNGPNFLLKIAPSLGAPVPLASPTSETFSAENIGVSSAAVDVQLGNYGDASTSPTLSVSGDFSETDDCSTAIPSGSKCDVNVVFIPTAAGTRTGVLTFNFGGSVPAVTVSLTGTGTAPAATLSTTSLGFGVQAIGTTSGSQQVTVTNSGTGALTITSVQATSQFAATSTCGAPVAPSSSCTIQVTFTPTASGVQAGTLTITDNASNSPQTVSLSGNQPAAFALTSSGGSSSTSATVAPGQTAMYALNLTGSYGFSNAVAFTCAGAPANSTCSVSPNPATVSGTSAIPVTVSIVTQAASASPAARFRDHNDSGRGRYLFGVGFTSMLLATFLSFASGNSRLRKAYFGFTTLLLFGICAGCGGGGSSSSTQPTTPTTPTTPATPAGAYTVTVTGTSGSLTQSMSLTLNVT